jgi:hypothetical protein
VEAVGVVHYQVQTAAKSDRFFLTGFETWPCLARLSIWSEFLLSLDSGRRSDAESILIATRA